MTDQTKDRGAEGNEAPRRFRVLVPATSANVGVGYDCLGLALDLTASFTFEVSDRLLIDGCQERFRGEDNLVWTSYLDTCRELYQRPHALHITIDSPVPLSGGLGSSSTCVVAGVVAAQVLHAGGIDTDVALDFATRIEGRPDNVAPALMGGLGSSFVDDGRTHSLRFDIAPNLTFVAIAPPYEVRTAEARKVMPKEVSVETAVWQMGHCVAVVDALRRGDAELLSAAAKDRLHEPYRATLIPDYEPIRRTALAAGGAAFLISGSGSTMLAITDGRDAAEHVAASVSNMVENHVVGLWVRVLAANSRGTSV